MKKLFPHNRIETEIALWLWSKRIVAFVYHLWQEENKTKQKKQCDLCWTYIQNHKKIFVLMYRKRRSEYECSLKSKRLLCKKCWEKKHLSLYQ